ncbi:MAG: hypothetical protein AAFO69_07765 [Bacteroidota bacterium]
MDKIYILDAQAILARLNNFEVSDKVANFSEADYKEMISLEE